MFKMCLIAITCWIKKISSERKIHLPVNDILFLFYMSNYKQESQKPIIVDHKKLFGSSVKVMNNSFLAPLKFIIMNWKIFIIIKSFDGWRKSKDVWS